jgi:hypothetical protein
MKAITKFLTHTLIVSSLLIALPSRAQVLEAGGGFGIPNYHTSLGLRGGNEGGVTFKHFLRTGTAVEGIISSSFSYGGIKITGLYEQQRQFPHSRKLDYFYGIGAHTAIYDGSYYGQITFADGYFDKKGDFYSVNYIQNYGTLGVDAILGIEYRFTGIPFTLGVDVKPYIDIVGFGSGHYTDWAFSLRYVIDYGPKPPGY